MKKLFSATAVLSTLGLTLFAFQNCSNSLPPAAQNATSTQSSVAPGIACLYDTNNSPSGSVIPSAYPSATVPYGSTCVQDTNVTCKNGMWSDGSTGLFSTCSVSGPPTTNLNLSASANNYSIFTSAGSPTSAVTINLTISAGVIVGSASPSLPALDTGALPAGSVVKIINYGSILGAGGAGGTGATFTGSAGKGGAGGPALNLQLAVSIDNEGMIAGGGGGGSGGASTYVPTGNGYYYTIGQGGGGGCGNVAGAGGAAGDDAGFGIAVNGSAGSATAGGAGGAGSGYATAGGNGGACGVAGGGPKGGAAGAAVVSNGNAISWLNASGTASVTGAIQ